MIFSSFFQREMKYMLVMVLWGLVGGITYRERREAGQGLRNRRSTSDDVIQVFKLPFTKPEVLTWHPLTK
jgi:hypothetical protein